MLITHRVVLRSGPSPQILPQTGDKSDGHPRPLPPPNKTSTFRCRGCTEPRRATLGLQSQTPWQGNPDLRLLDPLRPRRGDGRVKGRPGGAGAVRFRPNVTVATRGTALPLTYALEEAVRV